MTQPTSRIREAPMGKKEQMVWASVAAALLATIAIVAAKSLQGGQTLYSLMTAFYLVALADLAAVMWMWGRFHSLFKTIVTLLGISAIYGLLTLITIGTPFQTHVQDKPVVGLFFLARIACMGITLYLLKLDGVRLIHVSQNDADEQLALSKNRKRQYSLLDLLAWMAICSLFLAWLRWLYQGESPQVANTLPVQSIGGMLFGGVTFWGTVTIFLLPLAILFAKNTPHSTLWLVLVPTLVVVCPTLVLVALLAFLDMQELISGLLSLVSFALAYATISPLAFILIRLAGYRLVWSKNSAAHSTSNSSSQDAPAL